MAFVQVKGLPDNVKMPKLVYSMRGILKRFNVTDQFWITELTQDSDGNAKQAKIKFSSFGDASKAANGLNKYYMMNENMASTLSAKMTVEDRVIQNPNNFDRGVGQQNYDSFDRGGGCYRRDTERNSSRYSRNNDRSRSPQFTDNSKLDLEIELLRKQRLVIEEERRLLLERKKLEFVREFGASSTQQNAGFDWSSRNRDRRMEPRREEARPRVLTAPRGLKLSSKVLPQFSKPCKIIVRQMNKIIKVMAQPSEVKPLQKLLGLDLRRRLAICLEDKSYMPTKQIVQMYREIYTHSTDEAMITKALCNLRSSHWLMPMSNQKKNPAKKPIKAVNTPDDSTVAVAKKEELKNKNANNIVADSITHKPVNDDDVKTKDNVAKNVTLPDNGATESAENVADCQPIQNKSDFECADNVAEAKDEQRENEMASGDEPEDDWVEDGVDWNDDDDEDEEGVKQNDEEI